MWTSNIQDRGADLHCLMMVVLTLEMDIKYNGPRSRWIITVSSRMVATPKNNASKRTPAGGAYIAGKGQDHGGDGLNSGRPPAAGAEVADKPVMKVRMVTASSEGVSTGSTTLVRILELDAPHILGCPLRSGSPPRASHCAGRSCGWRYMQSHMTNSTPKSPQTSRWEN